MDGWLKIVPTAIEVTVIGKTNTVTYNGQEQQVEGFETDAPAGVDVKLKTGKTAVAKGTNPATYPMGLSAEDFDVTSSNYVVTINVVDGWLIIDPLPYNPVVPPITPPVAAAVERPSLMARPRWCPTPARPSRIRMYLWQLLV